MDLGASLFFGIAFAIVTTIGVFLGLLFATGLALYIFDYIADLFIVVIIGKERTGGYDATMLGYLVILYIPLSLFIAYKILL